MRAPLPLFVAAVVAASIASAQAQSAEEVSMAAHLALYGRVLNNTKSGYEDLTGAGTIDGTCTLRRACYRDYTSHNVNFNGSLTDVDFVQVKVPGNGSETPTAAQAVEGCELMGMGTTWRSNMAEASRGSLLYQYYAGVSNMFGVYPEVAWQCYEQSYVPEERPYFVAGATGMKDLVILLDRSGTAGNAGDIERLAIEVAAAKRAISQLSFYDFVAVIPFGAFPDLTFTPQMVRATIANVNALLASIDNTIGAQGPNGTQVSQGAAVEAAKTMLRDARASGSASGCTQAILLLTSGGQTTGAGVSAATFEDEPVVMFTQLVENDGARPKRQLLEATCASTGFMDTPHTLAESRNASRKIVAYFAAMLQNSAVRWSESYLDAFGNGMIISGALPIYRGTTLRGMVALDFPLNNLTTGVGVTETQVNNLLLGTQTCDPLGYDEAVITALQGGNCSGVAEAKQSTGRRYLGLWVVLALIVAFVPIGVGAGVGWSYNQGSEKATMCVATIVAVIFWIIALPVFFTGAFDDIVVREEFVSLTFVAEAHHRNPYRCCDLICDTCASGNTCPGCANCNDMVRNLVEGQCSNGYKCCRERCSCCRRRQEGDLQAEIFPSRVDNRSLAPRSFSALRSSSSSRSRSSSSDSCSRCCRCVESVQDHRCQSVCGTCYRPTVDVSYAYGGTTIFSAITGACARDQHTCPDALFAEYPIGSNHQGYVNPENPTDLRTTAKLRLGYLVSAIFFMVVATGLAILTIVTGCTNRASYNAWKTEEEKSEERVSEHKPEEYDDFGGGRPAESDENRPANAV